MKLSRRKLVRANWVLAPVLTSAALFGMTDFAPEDNPFMSGVPRVGEFYVGKTVVEQYRPDVEVEDFIAVARAELTKSGWTEDTPNSRIPRAKFYNGSMWVEIVYFGRQKGDLRSAQRPPEVFCVKGFMTIERWHNPFARLFGKN